MREWIVEKEKGQYFHKTPCADQFLKWNDCQSVSLNIDYKKLLLCNILSSTINH